MTSQVYPVALGVKNLQQIHKNLHGLDFTPIPSLPVYLCPNTSLFHIFEKNATNSQRLLVSSSCNALKLQNNFS